MGTGSDAATDIIATNLTVNNRSAGSAGDITLDTAVTNLDLKGDKIYIHEGAGINVNSISSSADLTLVATMLSRNQQAGLLMLTLHLVLLLLEDISRQI